MSEFVEAHRFLSPEASAEPGPWRNERVPYAVEIMDAYNDPLVREVWVQKSAQVAWTEIINNLIAYVIARRPGPMMLLQPTVELVESWSKDRLAPMLRDCPVLEGRVSKARAKDGANTLRHKTGPGWRLTMAGANSPAGLRMRVIRDLFCDEVDAYPRSAGKEGDPISIARKRQVTFWNKKLFCGSTPTVKGASRIETGFESTDMRYLHVPCPHCTEVDGKPSGYQRLVWEQVKWLEGKPDTARYLCKHCGSLIDHHHKQWMLANHRWVATKPFDGRAGFHLSELYSPFVSWAEMAANYVEAAKLPDTLQTFINTSLGETYEDKGSTVEGEGLLARREQFGAASIPAGVLMLTVGGDTQDDRVELQLIGWGAEEECWIIEQKVIRGDPDDASLWREVDEYLLARYVTEDGRTLRVQAAAIDSGGHHTQAVYNFAAPRKRRRVWAIRGMAGAGKLIWPRQGSRTAKSRALVYNLGVDTAKALLYSRLAKVEKPGPGYIHLCADFDDKLCAQLTSEKSVTKYVKGRPVVVWLPRVERAPQEAQDCWLYGYAAFLGRRGPEVLRRFGVRNGKPRSEVPSEPKRTTEPESASPVEQPEATPAPEPVHELKQQPRPRPQRAPRLRRNWVRSW
ncbi:MAG TPA: phage terminase large subunit family protein [Aquabacterium sp.]|nr:phage terminase large subunit family protein [Aquabacterium sp.]